MTPFTRAALKYVAIADAYEAGEHLRNLSMTATESDREAVDARAHHFFTMVEAELRHAARQMLNGPRRRELMAEVYRDYSDCSGDMAMETVRSVVRRARRELLTCATRRVLPERASIVG